MFPRWGLGTIDFSYGQSLVDPPEMKFSSYFYLLYQLQNKQRTSRTKGSESWQFLSIIIPLQGNIYQIFFHSKTSSSDTQASRSPGGVILRGNSALKPMTMTPQFAMRDASVAIHHSLQTSRSFSASKSTSLDVGCGEGGV
jgi:hypothetical protein